MTCEICKCDFNTRPLFRVNEFGVKGIWRCEPHLEKDFVVEENVKEIVEIIWNQKEENAAIAAN